MKKQVKKLRRLIQKTIPYRFHNILSIFFLIIFVIMIITIVVMNFIKIEPIAFDENNTFNKTYIEVNQVRNLVDEFYVADDGIYVYLYHDSDSDIVTSNQKIVGVPRLIQKEQLQELMPTFQKLYPNLKVNNVDDMMKYTGNYYYDYNAPALLYDMQVVLVMSCIPLICSLILLLIKLCYEKHYFYSLRNIIVNKKTSYLIDELKFPQIIFKSIHAAVLSDFLIINHPSPYVIDINQITWVYIEKKRFFFLFDPKFSLVIYDESLQQKRVLNASAFSTRHKKEMNQLLSFLSQVNSKIIIGYSQHNEMIFHQLKKE